MPNVHGTNGVIFVWDSGGTCRNLSGDLNNVTLSWTRDNPAVTTFGDVAEQRIAGIQDATLNLAGLYNSAETTSVNAVLEALMTASTVNTLINWAPAGSVSGCPLYSGCFLISSFEVNGPQGGPVAITAAFQMANGSVTAGSVA